MEELLSKLSNFFFDDEFSDAFASFREKYANEFDSVRGNSDELGEQQLKFTEIHKEYVTLYERKIEEFLQREGISDETFVSLCDQAMQDAGSDSADLVKALIAVGDYEIFMQLMLE